MIELLVFNRFDLLGEISKYTNLNIKRNYYDVSVLDLIIPTSSKILKLLKHGNILTTETNPKYGYLIEHWNYVDDGKTELQVTAYSLNYILSWRVIERQYRAYGTAEQVIKAFVNKHCIDTTPNRIIDDLRLAPDVGIGASTESTKVGGEVLEHCLTLGKQHEVAIDILINHEDKKFYVHVWQGVDRSDLQNVNDKVFFSKEFGNIIKQSYVKNLVDYKTTSVIAGEEEGVNQTIVVENDIVAGWDRRELYLEAKNLRSFSYEDGVEIQLTQEQYEQMLLEHGREKLAEYQVIEILNSEIDMYSQFKYGIDYSLGDKVSIKNDELGLIIHTRIVSTTLNSGNNGTNLVIEFGSNKPTHNQKIIKKVRRNGNL